MNIRDRLRSPLLALAGLLLAPFAPILLFPGGRVLGNEWSDNPAMFYYINEFAGRCWREGVIPLWNPHVMLGVPFLGEGQAAIFHPLSTLFVFLPTGVAINWLAALSFVLTGLFFHGWLRALNLSKTAAFFGALIWSYSNVIVVRIYAGHLSILLTLIEIPLILMLWERWRASRRIVYLAGIPFAYAFMIAAGYPQLLYIFSLFFFVYVLVGSAIASVSKSSARREGIDILLLGACIILGAGIGAIQLLPSADYAAQSMRQNPSLQFSGTFSFIPGNLVTILAPRFFGYGSDPALPEYYWRSGNYWEMTLYIGMLPLMLIVPGLIAAPRRRAIVFVSCAALFLLIALGRFTPLFPFLFNYVPGFKLFRGPSKYILVTELCLVTLAAFGLDGILKELETGARKLLKIALASGAVLLVCLAFLYVHNIVGALESESNWIRLMRRGLRDGLGLPDVGIIASLVGWATRELVRSAVMCALVFAALALIWKFRSRRLLVSILLSVLLLDLLTVFIPMLRTYDEKIVAIPGKLVKAVKPGIYPPRVFCPGWLCNSVIHHGLSSPSGYTGNSLARYNAFVNQMKGQPFDNPELEDPIPFYMPGLEFLSAEAEFLPADSLNPSLRSMVQFEDGGRSFIPLPMSHPRAWLAASPVPVNDADRARDYVLNRENDLRNNPVIETSPAGVQSKPLSPGEAVKFVSFNPTRVELQVTAAQPRVLVLAEMYERNWTATVGGVPAEVFPADYLLRGVKVPAGPTRVVFEYRPKSFRAGAMISLASIVLLIGLATFASTRGLALPEPISEPAPQPTSITLPRPRKKRRSR